MLTETLLKQPGFLYKIGQKHYYLGKWICKECTESDATDCVMMYHMCRNNHEEPDTNMSVSYTHLTLPTILRV